jgi:hypothetical protein
VRRQVRRADLQGFAKVMAAIESEAARHRVQGNASSRRER